VRQENLVFLIFVVAMAMVMGSTFAIVSTLSNYKPIQSKTAVSIDSQSQPATHESERDSVPSRGVTHADNNLAGSKGADSMLSPAETKEVKRMLSELGHTGPNLAQSLKSFQQKNQISNSGILDGLTLDSIINQLSLTKARSFRQ
jgi:hypothetical protein